MTLRISQPTLEGVYQGSKYLKIQALCEAVELAQLFDCLGSFWIYPLTGLVDGAFIEPGMFLREFGSWIEEIKQGRIPKDSAFRRILACAFTASSDALWKQEIPGKGFLVKIASPVVQVQAHFFTYSPVDQVFRSMTMGPGSIFWGLQWSFPQIYQEPKTMELRSVGKSPNAELFQKIRQWSRDATRATPFVVDGKRIHVPIRLGKECFSWIHRHPQLAEQNIGVYAG